MSELLATEPTLDAATLRDVDRATAELRRGGAVILRGHGGRQAIVLAAETADDEALQKLRSHASGEPLLLLTARRGAALGLGAPAGPVLALALKDRSAQRVRALADPAAGKPGPLARPDTLEVPEELALASIDLAKLARLLPAAVMAPLGERGALPLWAERESLLLVEAAEISGYQAAAARSLLLVADARVPLELAEEARILAFRPADGGQEHLAIVIGAPDPGRPVLTRIHSECFTGDLLGSLRCDCGEQLKGAIAAIAEAGSGVLLYLAQEGRGIGLANKLRAYRLQDEGADTFEANEQLGFDADERIYLPATEMLRQLGYASVRLLTNNPAKVAALARHGVEVAERVPHRFPSNGHNALYLETKARRFGHLF